MPELPYAQQVPHAWNPDDRSLNIFVKELDPFTLHRHPVAQSTDCIRTKMAYERGIHLWELQWNSRQRGTHAIIGMSEGRTQLHCVGYQSLIGEFSLFYHRERTKSFRTSFSCEGIQIQTSVVKIVYAFQTSSLVTEPLPLWVFSRGIR